MQAALRGAFPTPAMLRQMLRFRMDTNLDQVAMGGNYDEVLFELITWAEAEGRVPELVESAVADKPGNQNLKVFAVDYRAAAAKSPPGSVDLSPSVTIHDTGAEGTVAAMATVTAMETSLTWQGKPQLLSTRWLYWKAKQHDELHAAEGTWLTTVIYCAEQFGVPPESAWPYVAGDRSEPPPDVTGPFHRLRSFRLESLDDVPKHLAAGRPVVGSVQVFQETWFGASTPQTGVIPAPPPEPTLTGLAAVTLVGFNPNDDTFRFANTWGTAWGDAGFGAMDRVSADAHLGAGDLWAVEVPSG